MSDFVKLKYLGTVLICEDCIHEEIRNTLISELLQSFGPESFVFSCAVKNVEIEMYTFIILHVVYRGYDT